MNVSPLQALPPSQVQRVSKQGEDKDADFLALRLLNKRARVRLSPEPIDLNSLPGRGVLFAVANRAGLFAAAVRTSEGAHSLIISPLSELRTAFSSPSLNEIPFPPRHTVQLPGSPNIVVFGFNESKLLVGLVQGQILVYDVPSLSSGIAPMHTFPPPAGTVPKDILPNPEGMPALVAVLYDTNGTAGVESVVICDLQTMQSSGGWTNGGTPETTPTSLSWSPKGKQLAVGLQSGDVVTFSPSDTSKAKTFVPRPSSIPSQTLISATWLSNPDFHTVYVPQGSLVPDGEQYHLVLSLDAKANTSTEVTLNNPCLPFPGLRLPGLFTVIFRNWEPAKFLLFVGDSTSSDIGLIGCTPDPSGPHAESWSNFSLEETSTPTVPLDKDSNDTVLLGLSLDLTGTQTYSFNTPSGENAELPPPPVMYAYASDGTLVGWHVLNTRGTPYPGMVSAFVPSLSAQQSSSNSMQASAEAAAIPVERPFTQAEVDSIFGDFSQRSSAAMFGDLEPDPAYNEISYQQAGFGQAPMRGTTSTPSAFSSATTSSTTTGGFGSFASAAPAKFGQPTSFGFGGTSGANTLAPSSSNQPLASPMAVSVSASEEPMAAESEADTGLGGLSLGGSSNSSEAKPGLGLSGMFGAPTLTSNTNNTSSTPGFGSTTAFGGAIKPATGFGAFAGGAPAAFGQSSFGGASTTSGSVSESLKPTTTPSSGFGTSGFGSGGFGQSAFGQSSFGKPAFGAPAFGQSGLVSTASGGTGGGGAFGGSSGGFSAFANAGTSAFGVAAASKPADAPAKPIWATSGSEDTKKTDSGAASSAFATPATGSAFGSGASTTPVKPPPQQESTTPASALPAKKLEPSTTPDSSPFRSTGQGPTTGAFASLTTSTMGFGKLDSGFGAFGAGTFNSSSSPFANPKPTGTSPFASTGAFGMPSSVATTTPTKPVAFGSPSPLGGLGSGKAPVSAFGSPSTPMTGGSAFGKSTWGTPATPGVGVSSMTPPSAAKKDAFSAFAGGSTGFSAFSGGGKKSFSELLKGEDGSGEKEKKPASVFSRPSPVIEVKLEEPDTPERLKYLSDKGKGLPREEEEEGEEDTSRVEGEGDEEDETSSFLSQSFSEGSEEEEELPTVIEEDEEEEEEEEEPDEEEEGDDTPKDAANIPLPPSRTPSLAPKSPTPSIRLITPSPPATPEKERPKVARQRSTTPPGSPAPEPAPTPSTPAPAPVAIPSVGFSLGIGRPSTRPVRSSPLASAPISGNDESEEEGSPRKPKVDTSQKTLKPGPAGPKSPFGQIPSPSPSPKDGRSRSVSPRPKTPPLLSTAPPLKPNVFSAPVEGPPLKKPSPSPPPPNLSPSIASPTPGIPAKPNVFSAPLTGFGKPSSAPVTPATDGPKRPLFGLPSSTAPSTSGGIFSAPITQPSPGIFGKLPTPPPTVGPSGTQGQVFSITAPTAQIPPPLGENTTAAGGGPFGQKPGSAPPTFNAPPSNFFSLKSGSASAPSLPTGGSFGQRPAPKAPAVGVPPLGGAAAAPVKPPGPSAEAGMQTECANLYVSLTKELERLKLLAQEANQRKVALYKTTSGRRKIADLGDPSKWGVGDVHEFGRVMKGVEGSVQQLKELKIEHSKAIRQLESSMLRATTRKEEVVRFSKASTDAEFAKILKARTLSPELLETQSQLRRQTRVIRDRIQKLEDHLKASKKRLHEMKTGKPSLRAPSLDTINRTYNNIDIAISHQADDVARLSTRIHKLKLKDYKSPSPMGARDRRLPDDHRFSTSGGTRGPRGPINITPNVAATTAAALNAERAASRLKKSLLKARKEPLLNTQAVDAPLTYSDFKTPQKAGGSTGKQVASTTLSFNAPGWKGSFTVRNSASTGPETSADDEDWENSASFEPIDSFGSPHPPSARHRTGSKLHTKAVQLKRSPVIPGPGVASGAAPAPAAPTPTGFSWGPLPSVAPKSAVTLDARQSGGGGGLPFPLTGLSAPKTSSAPSLSGSWVTDGFGVRK